MPPQGEARVDGRQRQAEAQAWPMELSVSFLARSRGVGHGRPRGEEPTKQQRHRDHDNGKPNQDEQAERRGAAGSPDGSSTRPAGARAGMVFTDPPYNVSLGDHGGHQRESRRRRIVNDSLDPIAWETFVRAWARTLLASVDGAIYVCMSSKELPLVSRVLAEEGGHWSDTIIWAKDRFVLGRADYQRSYEPIWYGWREGVSHHWCGDRDQGDVWEIARCPDAPLHPTMKPLPLMERAISNSSRPGDLVLDPFLGSGSTLIACERTGRVCAGIEIDPIYAEVALRRSERFSGLDAERLDG